MTKEVKLMDGLTLLYVEDDKTIRNIMSVSLRYLVKDFDVACNGLEGLELFKEKRHNIILTDLMMPKMDGLEMIQKIREIDSSVLIVVLTAFNEADHLMRAIELNVHRYLIKPITRDKIGSILQEASDLLLSRCRLHQTQQYYEALMDYFIVSKTDPTGVITFANRNFCEISGYDEEELLGQSHNIVRHPETPKTVLANLWATIKAKKVWKGVLKNRRKDGGTYIVDASIFPLLNTEGEVIEYMAIRQDVTELEKLRNEQEEQKERLKEEHRRQKSLEEINRAKDSFLVMFTHELKTPLNAIINFSGYLQNRFKENDLSNPEKLETLAGSIKRNGMHMLENVTGLLDVAKLKAGKLKFHYQRFQLTTVVESIIEDYRELIRKEGITLELDLDPDLIIYSDERRLGQVFTNLLSNAIKFSHDKIRVVAKKSDQHEESKQKSGQVPFILIVEDNGEGITEKERVFELYEQEQDPKSCNQQGSGVGLYLVRILSDGLGLKVLIEDSADLGGAKISVYGEGKMS